MKALKIAIDLTVSGKYLDIAKSTVIKVLQCHKCGFNVYSCIHINNALIITYKLTKKKRKINAVSCSYIGYGINKLRYSRTSSELNGNKSIPLIIYELRDSKFMI